MNIHDRSVEPDEDHARHTVYDGRSFLMAHQPALDESLNRVCANGVELLRQLITIESPAGREYRLAAHIAERLRASDLDVQVHPFDGSRANLTARLRGSEKGGAVALSGHFDTAPVGHQSWTHSPYGGVVEDGRIYGRGAADMKGGLAAMVLAVEALVDAEVPLPEDVVVAFSYGETEDCDGAKKLVSNGLLDGVEAVIVGEPTGLDVGIAEKAALWCRASVQGQISHSAHPQDGSNAIDSLAQFLTRLSEYHFAVPAHPLLGSPSSSVGTITGGVSINVTPDHAAAEIDLRLLPDQDEREVMDAIRSLADPETTTVTPLDFKHAVVTPEDAAIVRAGCAAQESILGSSRAPVGMSYFSDAAIICTELEIPMAIIGPGDTEMSHQSDEWCDIRKLTDGARIYAHTILNYMAHRQREE